MVKYLAEGLEVNVDIDLRMLSKKEILEYLENNQIKIKNIKAYKMKQIIESLSKYLIMDIQTIIIDYYLD